MSYVIMSAKDVQSNQSVDLNAVGDKYLIYFTSYGDDRVVESKYFDRLDDAVLVFKLFVDAFARGHYSAKTRASWLA